MISKLIRQKNKEETKSPLNSLQEIKAAVAHLGYDGKSVGVYKEDFDLVEQELKKCHAFKLAHRRATRFSSKSRKIFDILEEKMVDIHNLLMSNTVEQYNGYAHWLGFRGNLTPEEFTLLKEIFHG